MLLNSVSYTPAMWALWNLCPHCAEIKLWDTSHAPFLSLWAPAASPLGSHCRSPSNASLPSMVHHALHPMPEDSLEGFADARHVTQDSPLPTALQQHLGLASQICQNLTQPTNSTRSSSETLLLCPGYLGAILKVFCALLLYSAPFALFFVLLRICSDCK